MKRAYIILITLLSIFCFQSNAQSNFWYWQNGVKTLAEKVDSVVFVDPEGNHLIVGHEYVDLGLPSGLLWATCNVGASKPEDYGDYFAWGETKAKDSYTFLNYKWGKGFDGYKGQSWLDKLYKYNIDSQFGTVDTFRTLEPEDDAATVNWGIGWRMPTHIEQMELKNGCDWEWIKSKDGLSKLGLKGTSKTNGNTIFLPAAGFKDGDDQCSDQQGYEGYYWASDIVGIMDSTDITNLANIYGEDEGPCSSCYGTLSSVAHSVTLSDLCHWYYQPDELSQYRCDGRSVRGVTKLYYTVNFFDVDSTLIQTEAVKILTSAIPPKINGYNMGWNDSSFVCVIKDLNIYAQKNKYIVNFYSKDSVLIESQKVDTAQSASTVKAPELGGFLFTGWSDSSFVNVKGNVDTYAQYRQGVAESGKMGDYAYVDLGLPSGLKWATYNVGATKIDDYGSYFSWGETEPKEEFSYNTYKWCTTDTTGKLDSLLKYNLTGKGIIDSLTILEAADDAATVNWGSGWRIPTYTELQELIDGCNWTWINDYNKSSDRIQGRLGTSKVNGNTIFLPTAGYYNGTKYEMFEGDYWASTINGNSNSCTIYRLNLNSAWLQLSQIHREFGLSVRAVCVIDTAKY